MEYNTEQIGILKEILKTDSSNIDETLKKDILEFLEILNSKDDYSKSIAKTGKILKKIIEDIENNYKDKLVEVQACLTNIILHKYQQIILKKKKKAFFTEYNTEKHGEDLEKFIKDNIGFDIKNRGNTESIDKLNERMIHFLKYYYKIFTKDHDFILTDNNNIFSMLSLSIGYGLSSYYSTFVCKNEQKDVENLEKICLKKDSEEKYSEEDSIYNKLIFIINAFKNESKSFNFILDHELFYLKQQEMPLWYKYSECRIEQINRLKDKNYKELNFFTISSSKQYNTVTIENGKLHIEKYNNKDEKENEFIDLSLVKSGFNEDEYTKIVKHVLHNGENRTNGAFMYCLKDMEMYCSEDMKENNEDIIDFLANKLNELKNEIEGKNEINNNDLIQLYFLFKINKLDEDTLSKINTCKDLEKIMNNFGKVMNRYREKYGEKNNLETLVTERLNKVIDKSNEIGNNEEKKENENEINIEDMPEKDEDIKEEKEIENNGEKKENENEINIEDMPEKDEDIKEEEEIENNGEKRENENEINIKIIRGKNGKEIIKKGCGDSFLDKLHGCHFNFKYNEVEYICDYNPNSKTNHITISKKESKKINGTSKRGENIPLSNDDVGINENELLKALKETLKYESKKNTELSSQSEKEGLLEDNNELENFLKNHIKNGISII